MSKLWGGRFSGGLDPIAWEYNASLSFDWRMAEFDVRGSIAWAKALMKAGVITLDEQHQIVKALTDILGEIRHGKIRARAQRRRRAYRHRTPADRARRPGRWQAAHRAQPQRPGCHRLLRSGWWMPSTTSTLSSKAVQTPTGQTRRRPTWASCYLATPIFQRSQPILLSHWWLSHFWPLAARPPAPGPVARARLRPAAGFRRLGRHAFPRRPQVPGQPVRVQAQSPPTAWMQSPTAIRRPSSSSSRPWSRCTFRAWPRCSIIMHPAEFGFIELSDAYSTGSSLMPQKKTPTPSNSPAEKPAPSSGA